MKFEKLIKNKPSDFIVKEIIDIPVKNSGNYYLLELKKSKLSTIQVIRFLSSYLRIKPSEIGFAGLKDKIAITTQYLTVPSYLKIPDKVCFLKNKNWVKVRSINFEKETGFCIKKAGYTDNPIKLGDNKGNYFEITIKNLKHKSKFYANVEIVSKYGCANYFGEQRFGSVKGRNDFIFLYLLKGEIEKALKLYFSIKGNIRNWGNWEMLYRDLSPHLEQYEKDLLLGLKRGLSFEKAIRILPKNIRLMFNFAFQAYLWNEYLRIYIESKYPYKTVPFIHGWKLSFYTEVCDIEYLKNLRIPFTGKEYPPEDDLLRKIIRTVLQKTGIDENDFGKEVAGIKILTDDLRRAIFFPENLKILKQKKNTLKVSFFLPKGSYATVLLRNLIF